ncbi:helix-turn-helix transcriptional regulator [uncultured Rikenella sp.]|uniref:helix-turn-helix domain-containing protein n=1 Tax=uncultured Rikenella sp. TaxID=368003 RepID=UPI00262026DE|nr:helix-turn-helix transcriptional regulator [uncultured Rikenella sp.]
MKERLAQFLKLEGLTSVKFAEIMEVQPSSISHLLAGRNKPNFEFISRMLLRFPDLNPDWIINGQGEVYRSVKPVGNDLFTDVNKQEITKVNPEETPEKIMGITDVNDEKGVVQEEDYPDSEEVEQDITNVNTQNPLSNPIETETVKNRSLKSIERIVLFYSDGSFDEYHN